MIFLNLRVTDNSGNITINLEQSGRLTKSTLDENVIN